MAITFKGTIAANSIDGNATTLNTATALNTTTGGSGGNIAAGDFMWALYCGFARVAGVGVLTDSLTRSWQSQYNLAPGTNRHRSYWLIATAGDVSGVTLTFAGGGNAADGQCVVLAVFAGVDPSSPLSTTTTTATATSTNPNPPSITPAHDDCAILIGYGSSNADAAPGVVTNYNLSQISVGADSNDAQTQIAYRILSGGNGVPEDPPAWDAYNSSVWAAFSAALKPDPALISGQPYDLHEGGVPFVNPHSGGQNFRVF